jgi:predicted TIM-barrel fold metal-dependent hydrolase
VEDADALVRAMDRCGIEVLANFTACWGDELRGVLDRYEGRYPTRFYTFAGVDWSRAGEPGFGELAARQLEDAVRAGARGLKVFKGLGLHWRDRSGRLVMPDDERLDPLWAVAGSLGVPVQIHLADPVAFFRPLDAHNPSYLGLQRRPEWHFYGPGFPPFEALIEAGIRLIGRHPDTTFIASHVGWYSENLKFVGEQMLDRLPNLYTDCSARLSTLGRQPYSARRFFVTYQDRILFGSDASPSMQTYGSWFRFLETADECFEAQSRRGSSWIWGIHLPDEVLRKVYGDNVRRLVPRLS